MLALQLELPVYLTSGQEASNHRLQPNDVGERDQRHLYLRSAVVKRERILPLQLDHRPQIGASHKFLDTVDRRFSLAGHVTLHLVTGTTARIAKADWLAHVKSKNTYRELKGV